MPQQDSVHTDRARAESFGSIAADYDKYRTSYPDALFADLAAMAPDRVLDIACGTGKVAVPLMACGLAVLGVEPDEKMAAVARSHAILVEVASFEDWDADGRTFDMITCGQGWHWIDPRRGAEKAVELLNPGGTLALFWSYPDLEPALAARMDAVYAEHAPDLRGQHRRGGGTDDKDDDSDDGGNDRNGGSGGNDKPHVAELEATGGFAEVETRTYRWRRTFTTEEWVRRSATFSDHHLLPDAQRAALLDALGALVDGLGGSIDVEFGTYTVLARTPD